MEKDSERKITRLKEEVKTLQKVNNANLVKLIDVF